MGQPAEPIRKGLPEGTLVRRWRRTQFLALGFAPQDAAALANAPVDLGEVRKLLEAGCPPETARRIVL
jgi:hypothetical protein